MLDFLHLVVVAPDSSLLYAGMYDPVLVTLSVVVAMFASYAALLVSRRVAATRKHRRMWLLAGGVCLGLGIWAMHFVGMLAFALPCTRSYDYRLTFLSTIPAMLACTLALNVISQRVISPLRLGVGAILLGAGIGAMHYSGMAAMNLDGIIRYDLKLFLLSMVVAVLLAGLALWIKFRLPAWPALCAGVMGLAVAGMHYTAMAAAYFVRDGDSKLVDSQISPTLLSAVVLTATSVIITGTIVATYVGKHKLFSFDRSYRLIGLLIALWAVISAFGVDYFQRRLADEIVQQETQRARQQAEDIAANIEDSLQLFKGIPKVTVHDGTTRQILRRFGPDAVPLSLAPTERKQLWTQDRELDQLNSSLAFTASSFKADAIWIVNAAGDCIAASNAGGPESFVGTNFADRVYFLQARAGGGGHQYAVNRASKAAGVFFSYPLIEQGRFLGAAVVKRSFLALSPWTRQSSAFLVDANGVIVFSPDKRYEFRTLPSATIAAMPIDKRILQYLRSSFEPLSITPWGERGLPGVVRLGTDKMPVVLGMKAIAGAAISVYVPRPLRDLRRLHTQRLWLFVLIAVTGGTLIVAASAIVLYLRETKRVEADLRVAAAAFESQEGMVITDAAHLVLRTNRAYTDITGFAAKDVADRELVLLDPDRHNAAFGAAIWQVIEDEGCWQGEIWTRRKNGEPYPESLVVTAVKNANGDVTHYVCALTDITARKAAEEEIRNLALYDFLTGLPNRRCLMERLHHALAASMRTGLHGALLFIDLDNFKDLNDTLGHNMGDLLLQQAAPRFRTCVRESDTVARLGGDEFIVMLEGLDNDALAAAEHARLVGEKILEQMKLAYVLDQYQHMCTASIGITLFLGHGEDVEALLKQTDLAMYQSKAAGRNTLRFFDPAMQAVVSARASLDNDLRIGLKQRQFQLYYQPQVDDAGNLVAAEALLRWHHPQRGMVLPTEFIPAAEESDLILALGDWVLETACAQLVTWAARPATATLCIAINVSPRQFRQPDFVGRVLSVLAASGADPCKLKVELTENLLLDDVGQTIAKMEALKTQGVGISLDDFGTGYSSLTYLKRLPICELKIDRSFVRDILTSPDDASIIKTILTLAHNLGIDAVAEGVESDAQRAFLANLGCKAFQGYLFGRPVPPAEFDLFVERAPADA
ncbi:EAL domain-containing protein [Massilia sp. RP-1-19]|uniref:EAL domain-containing protein n=1 Tax=Massilia polaris TaxID=2728846 RepID=A0A848HIH8_9BURK|nr:EAL domain-containing protein [Massilia polaris]NML60857.1 EAL domain-containing protein [Massilia polaris]